MIDIFLFLIILAVIIKTLQFAFFTFRCKNASGGIFTLLFSFSTAFLAAYLLLFGGA